MDQRELTYAEIMEIVEMFKASTELSELHLKYGVTEIELRKPGAEGSPSGRSSFAAIAPSAVPPPPAAVQTQTALSSEKLREKISAPVSASSKSVTIKSISVGTFYCAPAPGAQPFVSVGQRVTPDTTVGIIEVMKLMNAMQAGCSGVVSQILVKDGQSVEYDQPLIFVEQD
jgi:acetyl-CoA carboxylase biotin carboxyl carrier protein